MRQRQITVNAQGVFYDGIRQKNPDLREVAEALAEPTPVRLNVRDRVVASALTRLLRESREAEDGAAEPEGQGREEESLLDELTWSDEEGAVSLAHHISVNLHPVPGGVAFLCFGQPFAFPLPSRELAFVTAKLTARNQALGISLPAELGELPYGELFGLDEGSSPQLQGKTYGKNTKKDRPRLEETPPVMEAVRYFIHTGQEIDILERSASDGHRGDNWRSEPSVGKRVYEQRGSSHRVELRQSDDLGDIMGAEELDLETLEHLTLSQDTDFAFAMLYVVSTLAPPEPLSPNLFAGGWIDLDDVMEKIGWYPSELKAVDREARRSRIWNYLCYGNRAVVVGERTGRYRDPVTGEELETRIESPIWRIMSVERPVQRALLGEVPRRVQVVISKEWEPLLVSAKLAQYLPLAEAVGRIPPNKVAGDWARSIALVLARLWRMRPRETAAGTLRPTRRELLTHYSPKTKTVEELLDGPNPKRAVRYWHDALRILVGIGFIAAEGEGGRSVEEMLKPYSGYGWKSAWLDEAVDLRLGENLQPVLQERANALPPSKPQVLGGRRRGRPPKRQ